MKESELKSSDDLDAGWDVSDSSPPAASMQQPRSPAVALEDELDAGWDALPLATPEPLSVAPQPATRVESTDRPRTSEIRELAKVVAKTSRAPEAAATPPSHTLTKKERRQLERQQKAHAAQKQAEAKAAKRQKRKAPPATTAQQATDRPQPQSTPGPKSPMQGKPSRRHKQNKRGSAPRATRPDSPTAMAAAVYTLSTAPNERERNAEVHETWRWSALHTLVVGVIVLAVSALIWILRR
jgi:hypothetical protein